MSFMLFSFFVFLIVIIDFMYVIEECLPKWIRIAFIVLSVAEFAIWIIEFVLKMPVATSDIIHKIFVAIFLFVGYVVFQNKVHIFNKKNEKENKE